MALKNSLWKLKFHVIFRTKIQFKLQRNWLKSHLAKSSKILRVAQTLFLRNAPVKYVGNQNSMKCTLTSADHFRETAALEKHHGQQTNTRCGILIKRFPTSSKPNIEFQTCKTKIFMSLSSMILLWIHKLFKGGNYMRKYVRYFTTDMSFIQKRK